MKKYLCLFVAMVMVAGCLLNVSVTSFAEYGNEIIYRLTDDESGYEIIRCENFTAEELFVPEEYNDLPVVGIYEYAFSGCNSIVSLKIPGTVKYIGESAFAYCMSLNSVHIDAGVEEIERLAFQGCSNLTEIEIPDSVTSIKRGAFENCENLADINIPESVVSIGPSVFDYTALFNDTGKWIDGALYIDNCLIQVSNDVSGEFVVKEGTRLIADLAVVFCESITEIVLPESLINIGETAFVGCTGLKNIEIPKSVQTIGFTPFGLCTSLTEIKVVSENSCFSSLDGVLFDKSQETLIQYPFRTETSYNVPNTVKTIAQYSFSENTSITYVYIPDNVEIIEAGAFSNCTSLNTISIGSVNTIGSYCFSGCVNLIGYEVSDDVREIGYGAFQDTGIYNESSVWENGVLYIGKHLISAEETLSGEYVIKDGTATIANRAFYGTYITSVSFPESLKHIGADSFSCCRLEKVALNNGLLSIGGGAFAGNYIKEILIPYSVKDIQDEAFASCEYLKKINIPRDVEFVGEDIFVGCKSLETLVLQNFELTDIDKFMRFSNTSTKVENTSTGMFIGTGCEIKISEKDTEERIVTCIVESDINGDGVCDVIDCALAQLASSGFTNLQGAYLEAGDSDDDGEISSADYQQIVNIALAI